MDQQSHLLSSSQPSSVLIKCRVLCSTLLLALVPPIQCVGSINSVGTFSVYYASYYYPHNQSNPIVRNCFFVVFSAACLVEGVAFGEIQVGIAIVVYQKFGFRVTAVISGIALCIAYLCPLFISNPYLFAVVVSLGIGYGSGGSYYMCFLEAWNHFPSTWKGKIMGVIAVIYGLAPILWNSLFTFLCNRHNAPPTIELHVGETEYDLFPEKVADNVPWVSAVVGWTMAACYAVAILVLPSKEERSEAAPVADENQPVDPCPNLKAALHSRVFWILSINNFCGNIYGLFIVNAYKAYGLTQYTNDHFLSTIGSFAALVGAFSRVLFSSATDHFSFRVVYGVNILTQLVAAVCIPYALETNIMLYGLCVAAGFSALAGGFPAFIMEFNRVFGPK